ncbi:hypothetical protein FACS1894162_4060 [Bacteroidia bacterium]|nr:hypothetical protein FACS1894162_4060 [Bacteroidia bacterium]
MDTAQILIGEQTRLHLEIAADKTAKLQLPLIPDTLMRGVEVVEISKIDTTDIGNNRIQIKYDYQITSFDENLYQLPPFQVVSGKDTFYSNSLALKVSTIPVDTIHSEQFYDIKPVMKPQFVWMDYLPIVLYVWAFWLLVGLIVYLWHRWKNHQPLIPFKKEEKIILPPHVEAIQALDVIKSKKLWQQGKEKEYYSEVSDVVRNYIDRRFGVNAMEMTSGETLLAVRSISDVDFVFDNLKQMLFVSDMVKFAKYHPMPEENELSIGNAYLFVNSTTPVIISEENENNK